MSDSENTIYQRLLGLVDQAWTELNSSDQRLSSAVGTAIRIARLRDDVANLYWLDMETRSIASEDSKFALQEMINELALRYSKEDAEALRERAVRAYLECRNVQQDDEEQMVCGLSIGEIERKISSLKSMAEGFKAPEGMHPVDLYFRERDLSEARITAHGSISQFEMILERVRSRLASFLSRTERELLVGATVSDLFERNRIYVDSHLGAISERALSQLISAYKRQDEGDPEARSQALTSCRRVLKSLADSLYPSSGDLVRGSDGRDRRMSDEAFVTRLLQFATDRMTSNSSRELVVARISELAGRLDALNSLSSKGVHAEVDEFDVNQCVIQTYLAVGDLMRLEDRTAAAAQ